MEGGGGRGGREGRKDELYTCACTVKGGGYKP